MTMQDVNPTTRTFPRTLAEAFPDSLQASQHRAAYGAAITRYRVRHIYAPSEAVTWLLTAFLIGLSVGMIA